MLLPPPHMLPGLSPAPVKQKKKQAKKRESPHMLPELNPAPLKQKKKQAKEGKKEKKVHRPLRKGQMLVQNEVQKDVLEVPESLISPQAAEYDRVFPTFSRRNLCQKTSSENSGKTVSASKSLSLPEPTNICSSEKGKETGNKMMTNSLTLGNWIIELPPVGNQPIEEAVSSPPSSGKEHNTSPTKSYKMAQNNSEIMGKPESATKSSTIDGLTLDDCSAVSLSDDEVIGKAKLCRDTLLNQARAVHPKHKELLLSAFVDFLRLCFSFNKNTSSTALEELSDRAIDCASWGFNTNGALQRIRDFQVQREICNREKQVYDEKVAKLEKDISETLAMLEGLKAAQRALKEQGASISYGNISSPEFEGAFLEHLEELVAEVD